MSIHMKTKIMLQVHTNRYAYKHRNS